MNRTRRVQKFDDDVESQRVERLKLVRSHLDVVLVLDTYDHLDTEWAGLEHVLLRLARWMVGRVLTRAIAKLPTKKKDSPS